MNLIIDIGNSSTKLWLMEEKRIMSSDRQVALSERGLDEFLAGRNPAKSIISTVTDIPEFLPEYLAVRSGMLHLLTHKSKLPFGVEYQTPETLGTDRIAAVAGAFTAYPSSELLVIDAGTAITFDYLWEGKYRGGNISPGIDSRFRALNAFTGRLPLLARKDTFTNPGLNTGDAIVAGVIAGVVYEINEYIRTFEEKHKNPKAILTGGDSSYLIHRLSGGCIHMPELVAAGLNFILEYNA